MPRNPFRRRGEVEKAVPKSQGGTVARDISAQLAAMTRAARGGGDMDIGYDGRPLPRPEAWMQAQFGPNWPLPGEALDKPRPDTGQPEPRIYQYPVAWNLQYFNDRPVDWEILKKAADSPLFRACIEVRKTEVAALDWTFGVDDITVERIARRDRASKQDVAQQIREKYQDEIDRLNDFWSNPDRKNGLDFENWVKLLFEEQLVWDAMAVYPRMTYGGSLNDFIIIDGSTIKPLLDETGGRPEPPAPAYQQILYGFPRGEYTADTVDIDGKTVVPSGLTADQLIYRRRLYRTRTPYGFSPTEQALLDGMLYNARFRWMLAEYTEGSQPIGYLVNKDPSTSDWAPRQILEYERAYNDRFSGNTAERYRNAVLPPGYEPYIPNQVGERYKSDYDLHLVKLCAMHYGVTIPELGFTETGGLGSTGYHEGQEDVLFRRTRLPDIRWAQRFITEISRKFLNCPAEVSHNFLGLEQEDEAAAEQVARSKVESGRLTLNEDRLADGMPAYDFPEADMPMSQTQRGVIFLNGASKLAPPGVLIEPASEKPPEGEPGPADNPTQRRPIGAASAAQKELATLNKWLRKNPAPARPFECQHITADDAPELLDDPRVAFKASGAGPKDPAKPSSGKPGQQRAAWSPYTRP